MTTLAREDALRMAADWISAWNGRDLDQILRHYADDVEFCSPLVVRRMGLVHGRLHGLASLREYFRKGLAAHPYLRFELITVATGPSGICMVYRRDSGATVCEVLEIDEHGRIRSASAYYDSDP